MPGIWCLAKHFNATTDSGAVRTQMHKQLPRGWHRRSSRFQVVTKAAENSSQQELDMSKIGTIPFYTDEESIQDVFAFDGPAPERVNGRTAMIAFVGAAAAEAATGKSVLEQAAAAPLSVLTVGFLISIASIFPKYASGVPLARLLDSAGRQGLPRELAFFNKTHEIWLGRVAMLGITGLVAVEAVKGGALL